MLFADERLPHSITGAASCSVNKHAAFVCLPVQHSGRGAKPGASEAAALGPLAKRAAHLEHPPSLARQSACRQLPAQARMARQPLQGQQERGEVVPQVPTDAEMPQMPDASRNHRCLRCLRCRDASSASDAQPRLAGLHPRRVVERLEGVEQRVQVLVLQAQPSMRLRALQRAQQGAAGTAGRGMGHGGQQQGRALKLPQSRWQAGTPPKSSRGVGLAAQSTARRGGAVHGKSRRRPGPHTAGCAAPSRVQACVQASLQTPAGAILGSSPAAEKLASQLMHTCSTLVYTSRAFGVSSTPSPTQPNKKSMSACSRGQAKEGRHGENKAVTRRCTYPRTPPHPSAHARLPIHPAHPTPPIRLPTASLLPARPAPPAHPGHGRPSQRRPEGYLQIPLGQLGHAAHVRLDAGAAELIGSHACGHRPVRGREALS